MQGEGKKEIFFSHTQLGTESKGEEVSGFLKLSETELIILKLFETELVILKLSETELIMLCLSYLRGDDCAQQGEEHHRADQEGVKNFILY